MATNIDPEQVRKVIDDVKPIIGSLIAQACLKHPMISAELQWAAKEIDDKLEDYAIKALEQHDAAISSGG